MSSFRWPRRARLLSVLGYVGGCGLSVCFLWAGASVIINSLIGHGKQGFSIRMLVMLCCLFAFDV